MPGRHERGDLRIVVGVQSGLRPLPHGRAAGDDPLLDLNPVVVRLVLLALLIGLAVDRQPVVQKVLDLRRIIGGQHRRGSGPHRRIRVVIRQILGQHPIQVGVVDRRISR
nr:hypothetical protein [Actinoplanes sp. SE50/110]